MRIREIVLLVVAFISLENQIIAAEGGLLHVKNLQVEAKNNPEGIDRCPVHLSWQISDVQRNTEQLAYQVLVASSAEKLLKNEGDFWNSGKVQSDQSVAVVYRGIPLKSRTACFWKVKVWTSNGESDWSEPASWSMGLLHYKDWRGRWIGFDRTFDGDNLTKFSRLSARYFRKDFELDKTVKKATAYIIGLGLYELYINGKKVGDQVLAPSPTDYNRNVKYNTFDVTDYLQDGQNAVGVVLGNGRFFTMRQNEKPYKIKTFGFPKLLFQLELTYSDGSTDYVVTNDSWKGTADGPIRSNNEYDGEEYDARKEMPAWNNAGFDARNWIPAEYVQEPQGDIEAQINNNMKVMETIQPKSLTETRPGVFILDLGQNVAGWLKMTVRGKAGDRVVLRFAEILNEKGDLATANLRDAKATDVYILNGNNPQTWQPSFVYHGFRYVEITGLTSKPELSDFEAQVVYDEMPLIGHFETSDALTNQIYKNALWSIKANYKGIPVDCPQRNERQPWLGDRSTGAYGESFIFENENFYAKWMDDIRYSQKADGPISDVAPAYFRYYSDNMTWPGTYLQVGEMLMRQFGNTQEIVKHYPYMKKWLSYMQDNYMDEHYIMTKDSYGDWCFPPATIDEGRGKSADQKFPSKLISTAYHYYFLQMMQHFAKLSGNDADAIEYASLAEKVKDGFNKTFFHSENASYGNNTLTENILPVYFKMVPEAYVDRVLKTITDIIEVKNNGHLSTGLIGTQWLLRTLTENGRADLAFKLATNTTYPSWGYMVENGATTIWELWNGNTAAPSMNSYNHVMMLGDLLVWYYENLAGIKSSVDYLGFKQIVMKPETLDGLNFVKSSYLSPYGEIKSEWRKEKKTFYWNITVPCNSSAIVSIPATSVSNVLESGKNVASSEGITFLRMENARAVFRIGSGNYSFVSEF